MEKRLILFIVLSVGVMIGSMALNLGIRAWLGADKNQQVAADGEQADEGDAGEADAGKADAADAGDADAGENGADAGDKPDQPAAQDGGEKPDDGGDKPEVKPADPKDGDKPDVKKPAAALLGVKEQVWVALGSLDPDSEYSSLYTLNSRGAALERVELNDPRYPDLDDHSGYLGHLALTNDTTSGCRVNVVGPGTPAAGLLQPGDVIVGFNGAEVYDKQTLEELLAKTKPKRQVKVTLLRDGKEQELSVTLRTRPMELIRPEGEDPLSLLLTIGSTAKSKRRGGFDTLDALRDANWKMSQPDANTVEFSLGPEEGLSADLLAEIGLSGQLQIVKRYRLATQKMGDYKAYHAMVEIELRNLGDEPITDVGYVLDGPNGLPTEGWWYSYKVQPNWGSAGARDVIYKTDAMQFYDFVTCYTIWNAAVTEEKPDVRFNTSNEKVEEHTLQFAGVDAQYFAAALAPGTLEQRGATFRQLDLLPADMNDLQDKSYYKLTNATFQLTSETFDLAPGASHKQSFVLFTGPKDPALLAEYKLDEFVYYGWFAIVSGPLVKVLHFFHDITFGVSFGLAIIMLTLLVRSCMFPVSRKAVRNAQMMQALGPEMKAIAEKYKTDMEKRGKAQKELFAKYNYNPFGGCLLMFLQLPIFLGLYRALCVDISLRGAPLIPGLSWCSNLAAPDMMFYWETWWPYFTSPIGWLGPYFNILPLFTVVLFMVQQKMFTPPPADDQQKMQQKMMMWMTLLIGLMFFKVPSGLCLYFITSSLWGVFERKVLPKPKLPGDLEKKAADLKNQKNQSADEKTADGGNGAARAARRKKEKGRK